MPALKKLWERHGWTVLFAALVLLALLIFVTGQLVLFVVALWPLSRPLAGVMIAVVALFVLVLVVKLGLEIRAARRVARIIAVPQAARAAIDARINTPKTAPRSDRNAKDDALRSAMEPVIAQLADPSVVRTLSQAQRKQVREIWTDEDDSLVTRMEKLEATVIATLDRDSREIVRKTAHAYAHWEVISPFRLIDFFVMLWMSVAMVRKITALHTGQNALFASATTLRTALLGVGSIAAAAGIEEVAADVAKQSLTSTIAAKLLPAAKSATLILAVGLEVIETTRPFPRTYANKPTLKDLLRMPSEGMD